MITTTMKLSPRAVNDLLNLIDHVRQDISYGEGGTYYNKVDTDEIDYSEIKSSERAIEIIKKIILQRD